MRRYSLTIVCLLAVLFAQASERANVIIILTDDHGYADLGAYGLSKDIRTPHLDELAQNGVLMTNGYATAPQCVPSRAGIVTARYQTRFGVEHNPDCPMPLDEVTVAERMRDAGYVTGFVGKWHLDPTHESQDWIQTGWPEAIDMERPFEVPFKLREPYMPSKRGFDLFYDGKWTAYYRNFDLEGNLIKPEVHHIQKDEFRIDHQTDAALAFLEMQKDAEQPFFLHLAYYAPHTPIEYTEHFERFPGEMSERRRWGLASIAAMDDGVGKIMQLLREQGMEENTLIFFLGDNGAPYLLVKEDLPFEIMQGWSGSDNGPMMGEKGMITDGGVRVPFLAYWKGTLKPQVYDHPVLSLDPGATALALAGVEVEPSEIDGVNLLPFMRDAELGAPHEAIYWRFWGQAAIREGRWKFLHLQTGVRMLFDMDSEAHEFENVLKSHPEIAERLEDKLSKWSKAQKRPDFIQPFNGQEKAWYRHFYGLE